MSVGTYQWNQLIVAPTYITTVPYCHIVSVYTCSFVCFLNCSDSLGRFPWALSKRRTSWAFWAKHMMESRSLNGPQSRNGFLSKNGIFFFWCEKNTDLEKQIDGDHPLPFGWSWLHIVPWESHWMSHVLHRNVVSRPLLESWWWLGLKSG